MTGTLPLLRIRGLEITRTWRIWAFPSIMVFLAASSAILARFTNELLASALADGGASLTLPDPTIADSYVSWIKNLTQIALLVVIVLAAGAINTEVRSGAASMMLVKPASRAAYVLTHALSLFLCVSVSAMIGAFVSWISTQFLFGPAPLMPVLAATAVWLLLALVLIAAALLASVAIDSVAGAAGIGIGTFFALVIMGIFPLLSQYTPVGLINLSNTVATQTQANDHTLWWPLTTGLVFAAVLFAIAVAVFKRREI